MQAQPVRAVKKSVLGGKCCLLLLSVLVIFMMSGLCWAQGTAKGGAKPGSKAPAPSTSKGSGSSLSPSSPGSTQTTVEKFQTLLSDEDEGPDISWKKCRPPRPEKPPCPVSPNAKPVCNDVYDKDGPIDFRLQMAGPGSKNVKYGQSVTICAIGQDCDFRLRYCHWEGETQTWLAESEGLLYQTQVDTMLFSFNWSSNVVPQQPPVCAVYTAPTGGPGGKKPFKETIYCTVDDYGTAAPDDDPVRKYLELKITP
ncbi:hypothetical protein ACFLU6_04565 [Acidobacteriota bacterium]